MTTPANIADGGISSRASAGGTSYMWGGDRLFSSIGGVYNLCWCANMGSKVCEGSNDNFVLSAGSLFVAGPLITQQDAEQHLTHCLNIPGAPSEILIFTPRG